MIYVFYADGFEEIEGVTPVDVLRRAELAVKTVGVGGKTIRGAHDIPFTCDITEEEVAFEEIKAIVLPGGMPGTLNLEKSAIVQKALDFAVAKNRIIAAICAAPSILGHKGLLDGKKATVFPGFEKEMGAAEMMALAVVQDENFITGNGPGAALEFSLQLLEKLTDKETADNIAAGMQWER